MFPSFFSTYRRSVVGAWALMALANLAAGTVIASRADRQRDLDTMRRWGAEWLTGGLNIYELDGEAPDYPPHAIVVLSPLSTLPARRAVIVWAGINIGLALLVPWLAVRSVRPHATRSAAALSILMFLCWGGFRTLLQFTLLSLALGLAAMVIASRRPIWSGICLGLALMKPQIAVPFLLWAAFTGRRRLLVVAAAVVAAGTALFSLRVGANPLAVGPRYLEILRLLYTGDDGMIGLAQLRPLIALGTSSATLADTIAIALALTLLAMVCIVGVAERRTQRIVLYAAPPLGALWSLLTFYHLTYSFVLLLPLAALLMFDEEPASAAFRRTVFWTLQCAMMIDGPGLWRLVTRFVQASATAGAVIAHFDRALMLVLFACALAIAARNLTVASSLRAAERARYLEDPVRQKMR